MGFSWVQQNKTKHSKPIRGGRRRLRLLLITERNVMPKTYREPVFCCHVCIYILQLLQHNVFIVVLFYLIVHVWTP